MRLTRRKFLSATGLIGAGLVVGGSIVRGSPDDGAIPWCGRDPNQSGTLSRAGANSEVEGAVIEFEKHVPKIDPSQLAKFVDPLPIPSVLQPAGMRADPENPKQMLPCYRMEMAQFLDRVHRDLKPARLWGYNGSSPGPVLEAQSGKGFLVEWHNRLPLTHLLRLDPSIHGAERSHPAVRNVVHVHGAKVPPDSDGYPEAWFVPGKSAVYHYPNRQDATTLWYHDHALGITRLNVYAGLYGMFIIRDEHERSLNLPSGKYEIPLTICDRAFNFASQLEYMRFHNLPYARWVPEFHGNAILLNGRIFPYLDVDPRKYRLRIVNVANSSFFNLSLGDGAPFFQIGSDQGLLREPIAQKSVMLAPAERADLIIDFSRYRGKQLALRNGDTEIMQFRVATTGGPESSALPQKLREIPRLPPAHAVRTRVLTLDEYFSRTGSTMLTLLNGTRWSAPITENPVINTTEIWSLVNLTQDTHPIHIHLIRFQVLDRRPFDVAIYKKSKALKFSGPPEQPEPNLRGWKDTVCVPPGMVVRIIMKFEGFTGRYVWHCHILEHEDNEMMRPYDVQPGGTAAAK
ncbi:MAG: multicopper oxidase family protein [Candidatus Binataceae bacterium]